jgi:hypothetical protein
MTLLFVSVSVCVCPSVCVSSLFSFRLMKLLRSLSCLSLYLSVPPNFCYEVYGITLLSVCLCVP